MQTRKLGYSELHLSTVGLGTWAIGGDWFFGWGKQDENESIDTIHRAFDLGINWLDTAPAYGLGRSEEVVGKAIKGYRDKIFVATKCGLVWDDPSDWEVYSRLKAGSVRQEVEDSLRRLQIDVIDLYQIHWPNPDEDVEEAWSAIADLVREGKIRYAGVSNFSVDQLKRIQPIHPVASLQPEYSMLKRGVEEELLPYCAANNIGVVAYSPLRSGVLTEGFGPERLATLAADDWRHRDADFREPSASINVEFMKKLRLVAQEANRPVSQLATAWVISRPEVTAAIVGARRPGQIESSAPAGDWDLSAEILAAVDALLVERKAQLEAAGIAEAGPMR